MSDLEESALVALARSGDRQAFAALVDRHKNAMVSYIARLTGSRDRAEDLAQETFVRLFEALPRYRDEGRLVPFLYRVATNLVRSEERRARRWRLVGGLIGAGSRNGHAPSPQAELLRDEAARLLSQALAEVDLRYRVPLLLHEVEELPYQEIAKVVGCPEGTVKSRISRARQELRERLGRHDVKAVLHG